MGNHEPEDKYSEEDMPLVKLDLGSSVYAAAKSIFDECGFLGDFCVYSLSLGSANLRSCKPPVLP